jgi:hypothetical protein
MFPRYAWSVPLKDKTSTQITWISKSLFQNRYPITILPDKGTEFVHATLQQYLKNHGVIFHTNHNPDNNDAIVKRFNRTLKTKIYKYFIMNNTYRYFVVINKRLTGYNKSVHYAIGMPPTKVNPSNIYSMWRNINSLSLKFLTVVLI